MQGQKAAAFFEEMSKPDMSFAWLARGEAKAIVILKAKKKRPWRSCISLEGEKSANGCEILWAWGILRNQRYRKKEKRQQLALPMKHYISSSGEISAALPSFGQRNLASACFARCSEWSTRRVLAQAEGMLQVSMLQIWR